MDSQQGEQYLVRCVGLVTSLTLLCLMIIAGNCLLILYDNTSRAPLQKAVALVATPRPANLEEAVWQAPDSTQIPLSAEGDLIRYGKELIAHTSKYLGPRGKVARISNGMNCQNCHLRAGAKPFGNNYAAVVSMYPRFRARSGSIETIEKRINDCIERSLNGEALAENSLEMRAIIAWFQWLGKDVPKGVAPKGSGIVMLPLLPRAADPLKGKIIYAKHCELCHGAGGLGYKHPDSVEWKYPPLAGDQSYNTGAGLLRLSRFAGYVKTNMPYGTTWEDPVLTDEEAWDVAAYINSLKRPAKRFKEDWPDITAKPFDHPFGPYADSFPEAQHKYGPFDAIRRSSSTARR